MSADQLLLDANILNDQMVGRQTFSILLVVACMWPSGAPRVEDKTKSQAEHFKKMEAFEFP